MEIDTQYTLDPLSYTDQGLEPETFYMYRLEAYDEDMDNLLTSDKIASARTTPLIRPSWAESRIRRKLKVCDAYLEQFRACHRQLHNHGRERNSE